MNRNSLEFHSNHIPTLQSIDAHSQVSIDLRPNQQQPLIMKILVLCLQLQHRDRTIINLQQQLQNRKQVNEQLFSQKQLSEQMRQSQVQTANKQLLSRYDRIQNNNKHLISENAVLKNQLTIMQRTIADMEMYKQRSMYNDQLQQKVYELQARAKKYQQEKIQLIEREKNLKRENSMLSFSVIKSSEKNRIRDLQTEIGQQRAKLQTQKRTSQQLRHELDKKNKQIRIIVQTETNIKRSLQQKIRVIQINKVTQDLKKSQCTAANQQKLALLSQQLHRLKQQTNYQRTLYNNQKQKLVQKQQQVYRLHQQNKKLKELLSSLQVKLTNQTGVLTNIQQQMSKKQNDFTSVLHTHQSTIRTLRTSHADMEQYLKQKGVDQNSKAREIQRLQSNLQQSQRQKQNLKSQVRKLKRKTAHANDQQCQICRIRSLTVISSTKSLANNSKRMNLQQIINETQKLNLSSKKVQSLLSHHEMSVQISQHTISNINISQ